MKISRIPVTGVIRPRMNTTSPTSGDLDERTAVLMRFAARVAPDAAPMSYLITLAVAQELDITPRMIQAGLIGRAPSSADHGPCLPLPPSNRRRGWQAVEPAPRDRTWLINPRGRCRGH